MRVDLNKSRKEKDFEQFVRALPSLNETEFCGLRKILNVSMIRLTKTQDERDKRTELAELKITKDMTEEEKKAIREEAKKRFPPLTMEEILDHMMDRFLELGKRQRKEILQVLKDAKRGL